MANGKAKGSEFEREISKRLSNWWSSGKSESLFWRTPGSGAKATHQYKTKNTVTNFGGDIMSTHSSSKIFSDVFYIECKSYKQINLWSVITESKDGLQSWWIKAVENAKIEEKVPLLILHESNKPTILISVPEFSIAIIRFFGIPPKFEAFIPEVEYNMCVYTLDSILSLDIRVFKSLVEDFISVDVENRK